MDWLNDQLQERIIVDRDPADERTITWDDGKRTVGVGDLIRTRQNNYQARTHTGRPVVNGSTWRVTAVEDEGVWAHSEDRVGCC